MEFKQIKKIYDDARNIRLSYAPLWTSISKYVGIVHNPTLMTSNMNGGGTASNSNNSEQKDQYIDDSTASDSVNQASNYLQGIMWGNVDNIFEIVPSSNFDMDTLSDEVKRWYKKVLTKRVLFDFNHMESGLSNATQRYFYDQWAFGTSAIGCYLNNNFIDGIDENALCFKYYGVQDMCIVEGANGMIDYCFVVYNWTSNQIVNEICVAGGEIQDDIYNKLPKKVRVAWEQKDYSKKFKMVYGFYPKRDFNPKLMGKKGYKYSSVWFSDCGDRDDAIIQEYDAKERPISVGRMLLASNEVYGRSAGTMLISSIRMLNFLMTSAIDGIEKMSNPALVVQGGALYGDDAFESGAGGLVVLNNNYNGTGKAVEQMYSVGDTSGIYNILMPYLKANITKGFSLDVLLDFNSSQEMTATESMQRFAIRGKSIAGLLRQQRVAQTGVIKRGVSLVMEGHLLMGDDGFLGEVPAEVMDVYNKGQSWFDIKYNNEMERLTKTDNVEKLTQLLQGIMAIAQMKPEYLDMVDWYEIVKQYAEITDNSDKIMSRDEFEAVMQQNAQAQQQMMQAELMKKGSEAERNMAHSQALKRGDATR